jgi:hypothetical protein
MYQNMTKDVLGAGLPDFAWYNIPKREKLTKISQIIPKGHKQYQMAKKYSNISHSKALQNMPKL